MKDSEIGSVSVASELGAGGTTVEFGRRNGGAAGWIIFVPLSGSRMNVSGESAASETGVTMSIFEEEGNRKDGFARGCGAGDSITGLGTDATISGIFSDAAES